MTCVRRQNKKAEAREATPSFTKSETSLCGQLLLFGCIKQMNT